MYIVYYLKMWSNTNCNICNQYRDLETIIIKYSIIAIFIHIYVLYFAIEIGLYNMYLHEMSVYKYCIYRY